ncbi:hypothetical protein ACFYSC_20380 [Streptosporangium sp. NPDC004379]|uniref:hypothetical protein n=1 Tax=Streptosporangium sp. NPDC004379 TaxID=3366189 RepID=UPI0036779746
MRVRLSLAAAAVLAAVASAAPAAPALASSAAAVEPGTYRIVDAGGYCLRSDSEPSAMVRTGECDTSWELISSEEEGGRYVIKQAGTENCLTMSRLRIYPPFVGTAPCGSGTDMTWTVADAGGDRVVIALGSSFYMTGEGEDTPVRLLPFGEGEQRWTLRQV